MTKINAAILEKLYLEQMDQNSIHQQHRQWLSQLDFYEDEVKIFREELLGVVQKHPNYFRMVEHVDEYRTILMRKLEHIDNLRHQIVLHERNLVEHENIAMSDHNILKTAIENFVQDFEAMKANFRRFVSHND
ncbi:MAG: hypothetical protein SFU99_20915 [Saprospiraceae bacterium]|nr:hypothetical protein [Saprospiraceae bacterium]